MKPGAAAFLVATAVANPVASVSEQPIRTSIPRVFVPVQGEGSQIVAFEVIATSDTPGPVELLHLSIIDAKRGHPLARYEGPELIDRTVDDINRDVPSSRFSQRARIYVEVESQRGEQPASLIATVEYKASDGVRREAQTSAVAIDSTKPTVLGRH